MVGTRPEAIKLFPLILALRGRPGVEVRVCTTGQHREGVARMLALAGIEPDLALPDVATSSLDALLATLVTGIGTAIDRLQPMRVVVQGDTSSAMAATLAAHHRRLPVAHVEAGLRTGDLWRPWPEEANRRIISAIADRHFAPTPMAAAALAREGRTAGVHVTGNTVVDALHWMRARIVHDPGLVHDVPLSAGKRLILVTAHRRESWDGAVAGIARALVALARRGDVSILWPVHPNPALTAAIDPILAGVPAIRRTPPLDYPSFVAALDRCHFVLTDSGGVQEEAPALGKPVLVLRDTTERSEAVAAGTARLVGTDPAAITAAAAALLDDDAAHAAMARPHQPFGDGRAADRIAAILADTLPQPAAASISPPSQAQDGDAP